MSEFRFRAGAEYFAISRYVRRDEREDGRKLLVFLQNPPRVYQVVGYEPVQRAIESIDEALRKQDRQKNRKIIIGNEEIPMSRYLECVKGPRGETLTIYLGQPDETIVIRGADNVQLAELELNQQFEDQDDARLWKTVGFYD